VKRVYELAGGTVTRESANAWRVNAPDGRHVGTFKTRKTALGKAQDWDKWDAFASLQDVCFVLMPFTTTQIMATLGSIKDGGIGYMPNDEQIQDAITLDVLFGLLLAIGRRIKKDKQ